MIMKFVKIIMFCVICLPISGISQNIEIPSVVLSSFSSEFSDKNQSNTLTWEMKDDKFIAKFKFEDKKSEITYNSNGMKIEFLVEISKERLKHHHNDFVTENYPNAVIFHAYLQNSAVAPERIVLDIIENGKTIRLYFRPDGTFFEEKRF
jgi:hypothetical protein